MAYPEAELPGNVQRAGDFGTLQSLCTLNGVSFSYPAFKTRDLHRRGGGKIVKAGDVDDAMEIELPDTT